MVGQTVSHYEITEKIGEGGMGVVYKARDMKLDRTVALKFLSAEHTTNEESIQRFIREAKAASSLEHPNICTIHEINETPEGPERAGQLFIVMPAYEGETLSEKIKRGPLQIDEALDITMQIADGLQAAHKKGIVHRDINGNNIFLTDNRQVKIMDFGLAQKSDLSRITKTEMTMGTIPYISPEQVRGEKVDHRTDIWSLGVIFYEMITGRLPFRSDYTEAVVYAILKEDPESLTSLRTNVTLELEWIVKKCLEKKKEGRYQHTDEIIIDLRKVDRGISSGVRSKVSVSDVDKEISLQPGEEKKTISPQRVKPVMFGLGILLLLVGVYYFVLQRPAIIEIDRSIAVLPFENLSPNPDDAFFADGVHEDIIIQLAGLSDVRVIARSSVLRYKDEPRELRQIARDLDVATIMEGSVRRADDVIRVAVQLVDPYNNRTIWAQSYERSMTDIFEIQHLISSDIASALKVRLTPEERVRLEESPTTVPEAYEFYMRGREYFLRRGFLEEDYRTANRLLYRAIEYDPQFPHAYALLSRTYSIYVLLGYDKSPEAIEKSRKYAERAIELRPELVESQIAMGHYYDVINDYDKALEHYYTALQYQPNNAEIYLAISFVERRLGKFENALENLKKAILLDPLNNVYQHIQAEVFWALRKYQDAHDVLEKLLYVSPDDYFAQILYLFVSISRGDGPEVVAKTIREHPQLKKKYRFHCVEMQFRVRDFDGMISSVNEISEDIYQALLAIRPSSYYLGLAYDYLNDRDRARHYYEVALSVMKGLPAHMHDDPRYRMGLGKIYAGLGYKEQAIAEGSRAAELMSISIDAFWGPWYQEGLAHIYARLNESNEAVEILHNLLSISSHVSIPLLRINPSWDPIRDTPEFQSLLREFEERVS